MIHFAELNVIADQFGNLWVLATDRAALIPIHLQFAELHAECIVKQQATNEWFAFSEQQLDSFCRHHNTNYAWEHAQDTGFTSARNHTRRRRCPEHAAIARSLVRFQDGRLSFKLENTAVYNRLIR